MIVGTILGFLIGAYMPITYFPKGVQYFTLFIPGSYSAGLFRNCIMRGALEQIAATLSEPFAASLEKEFSMKFDFFGTELGVPAMACVLAASVVLFALLLFALSAVRLRKNQ